MRVSLLHIGIAAAAIALLVGVFVWYVSDQDYEIKNYPPGGTKIVAFGDSLVTGAGASSGNDFVSVLSQNVELPIINAGRNGDTTASALQRLSKDVLSRDPDIVIVLLGGNDALHRIPHKDTFANLGTIIDRIQEQGAVVVLLGVRGGLLGDPYQKDFKKLAQEKGTAFVPDILKGIFGKRAFMADRIHPNDQGNALMAEHITPVLQELLPY